MFNRIEIYSYEFRNFIKLNSTSSAVKLTNALRAQSTVTDLNLCKYYTMYHSISIL